MVRDDSRFALSHWETMLLCNDVSRWLGASLESALYYVRADFRFAPCQWEMLLLCNASSHWLVASWESALHCVHYSVVSSGDIDGGIDTQQPCIHPIWNGSSYSHALSHWYIDWITITLLQHSLSSFPKILWINRANSSQTDQSPAHCTN